MSVKAIPENGKNILYSIIKTINNEIYKESFKDLKNLYLPNIFPKNNIFESL